MRGHSLAIVFVPAAGAAAPCARSNMYTIRNPVKLGSSPQSAPSGLEAQMPSSSVERNRRRPMHGKLSGSRSTTSHLARHKDWL